MRRKSDPPERSAGQPGAQERPAFRQVYDEHVDRVWWMLRALGVPEASCADATQEVYLVVYRLLPKYEPRGRIRGWLAAIAAKIAAQFRRREGRFVTSDEDPDEQAAADFDVDRELASSEEVRRVLDSVPPALSLVFILYYFEELEVDEIASHLGDPVGTVKTRLRRARAAVKAAWTRHKARERSGRAVVVPLFGTVTWRQAGKETPRLPDEVRERIWAGVQHRLGGGDGGGGAGAGGGGSVPGALGGVVAVPVRAVAAGTGLLGLLLGVVLGALWDPLHPPRPGLVVAPLGVASAVPSPAPPAQVPRETSSTPPTQSPRAVPPTSAPVAASTPPTQSPRAVPPASAPTVAASAVAPDSEVERDLIDDARARLNAGDPDGALVDLRKHAATFHGGGRRAQERETLWIAALVRAGRTGEARERLARFEALYPKSPSLGELRAALASASGAP